MKKKYVIIVSLIILLLTGCSKNENERIQVKDLDLTENSYGKVIYTGEMLNDLPDGKGEVYIENDEQITIMNGDFEKGIFIKGDLNIDYKNSNKYIHNKGSYINNQLTSNSSSEIKNEGIKVYREGEFEENQLNGKGVKLIDKDGIIIYNVNGLYENDKLK